MTAISVDFAPEATIFGLGLSPLNSGRPGLNSIIGAEIAGQVMTKTGPDDPGAETDRRWSALMAAAQAGDGVAYQALLRDCTPVIKAIARRRGVVTDRIDDVAQDVLLTIHRARQTYDPNRSFTAWLSVIADRRAIDLIRRIRRQLQREIYAPLASESHTDESADPSRGTVLADRNRAIACAVETLPSRQREAIRHLLIEERSLADAAAMTRRSKGSLKVNLHRALKALRGKMERGD